ncbi:MAG: response regulator [Myxococcota bacterium]
MAESPRPRLLIVDDEARILAALRRALRREGYEILVAESGVEGLELLARERVDLILSDYKMPSMSGVEFFDRAAGVQSGIPKILITGWTEAVPREKLDALGVKALLPKPWDDAELKSTLRDLLSDS